MVQHPSLETIHLEILYSTAQYRYDETETVKNKARVFATELWNLAAPDPPASNDARWIVPSGCWVEFRVPPPERAWD
jgi:hypothetical protein